MPNQEKPTGSNPAGLDPSVFELLACPACHGALRAEASALACAGCGRRYPVEDGIAVLIAERSVRADAG